MRPLRVVLASSLLAAVAAGAAVGGGSAGASTPVGPIRAAATTQAAGTYVAVTPFRAVNTRTGALGNHEGAVGPDRGITPTIGGHGGVPVTAAAVVVTITAAAPTAAGSVVAYAAGTARPGVSNLRYAAGHNTTATAVVQLSADGRITLFNAAASGSTDLLLDVSGYYVGGTPSPSDPGVLHTITPARAFHHTVAAAGNAVAPIGGQPQLPRAGVGTVAVMISAEAPAKSGTLVAYATGSVRPNEPTMHFTAGNSATQFAIVPTDGSGRITVHNSSAGPVRVAVDVVGYTVTGVVSTAGALQPRLPARIVNGTRVAADTTRVVPVVGHGGVPSENVSAVVVTISAASSTTAGGILAWPGGRPRPGVTSLEYSADETVSNVAVVQVSRGGSIALRNISRASVMITVDVDGYVPAKTATAPPTSMGRYVRNITADGGGDVTTMTNEGCSDAIQSKLVLLELGAQTVTAPLSMSDPGVLLSGQSDGQHRLDYGRLTTTLTGYLQGFASCATGAATVALGTSNDGDYSGPYTPAQRGSDWATQLIVPLRAAKVANNYPNVDVVGADDIEAGFAGTEQQAEQWEAAYLAIDNTGDSVGRLIYNGSADGCPTGAGVTGRSCGSTGWTQTDYYRLAHGMAPGRVQVLPQIYLPELATQWADIEATGGNDFVYAGVLTEYAACPAESIDCPTASLEPAAAWAALLRARSGLVTSLSVPSVTDLRVDP